MEYIWTFNGSAEITLKVPQTLDSLTITPFIADSCCVLCRTSSRYNITNKIPKKLKFQHKRILDKDRRYLCCKNCRERSCDICVRLFYDFFKKKSFLKSDNPWMIVAKSFLESNEPLVSTDGYKSHFFIYRTLP